MPDYPLRETYLDCQTLINVLYINKPCYVT